MGLTVYLAALLVTLLVTCNAEPDTAKKEVIIVSHRTPKVLKAVAKTSDDDEAEKLKQAKRGIANFGGPGYIGGHGGVIGSPGVIGVAGPFHGGGYGGGGYGGFGGGFGPGGGIGYGGGGFHPVAFGYNRHGYGGGHRGYGKQKYGNQAYGSGILSNHHGGHRSQGVNHGNQYNQYGGGAGKKVKQIGVHDLNYSGRAGYGRGRGQDHIEQKKIRKGHQKNAAKGFGAQEGGGHETNYISITKHYSSGNTYRGGFGGAGQYDAYGKRVLGAQGIHAEDADYRNQQKYGKSHGRFNQGFRGHGLGYGGHNAAYGGQHYNKNAHGGGYGRNHQGFDHFGGGGGYAKGFGGGHAAGHVVQPFIHGGGKYI